MAETISEGIQTRETSVSDESQPPRKKRKQSIDFRQKMCQQKQFLSKAITNIKGKYYMLCFVKIKACNGADAVSFSHAWCNTKRNYEVQENEDDLPKLVNFSKLFNVGMAEDILEGKIDDELMTKGQIIAFERLADFMEDMNETSKLLQQFDATEVSWAAVFGTHFLQKLAVSQQMTISDSGYSEINPYCPCGCKAHLKYGDTSMGHYKVWHGSVDILLNNTAFKVLDDADIEVESAVEVKRGNLEEVRSQLIAETIVFSCALKTGLVPTIAVSMRGLIKVYLYDLESDLLYESMELDLFLAQYKGDTKLLNLSTVLAVWLVVNHAHFCKGVPESHVKFGFTSDFKQILRHADPELFEIYEKKLQIGNCMHGSRMKDKFTVSCLFSDIDEI